MSKRKLEEGYEPPLSAFAARRKAQAGAEASDGSATVHVNSLTLSPSTITPTNDSVGPELPQTCVDSPESGPSDEVLVTPQAQTPSLPINEVVVLLGVCPEGVQLNKSAESAAVPAAPVVEDEPLPARQLSTFKPNDDNVLRDDAEGLSVMMKPGESLVILGQYDLKVTKGTIYLSGAILTSADPSHRVYASVTHAIAPLICVYNTRDPYEICQLELSACNSGIRSLKNISPLFERIWNQKAKVGAVSSPSSIGSRSFVVLYSSNAGRYKRVRTVEIPKRWQTVMEGIVDVSRKRPPPVVLVCGLKSSGKSTLARHLVNASLTNRAPSTENFRSDHSMSRGVAYMDLDPGQPEFSPAGQLSLLHLVTPIFGPPFTHLVVQETGLDADCGAARLVRAHTIASSSPRGNPYHFEACAVDLMNCYREELTQLPLIVNYSSWLTAEGVEVLERLIQMIRPSDMIFLSTEVEPSIILDSIRNAIHETTILHQLSAQTNKFRTHIPADLRAMQELSYFHLAIPRNGHLQWDARPLARVKSWTATYGSASADISGVMILDHQVPPQQLDRVIDGTVMAVVAYNPDKMDITDITVAPDPAVSHCIGHAYVRSLQTSATNTTLNLLAPEQHAIDLAHKRHQAVVLVGGKRDIPSWAYLEESTKLLRSASKDGEAESKERWKEEIENLPWLQIP